MYSSRPVHFVSHDQRAAICQICFYYQPDLFGRRIFFFIIITLQFCKGRTLSIYAIIFKNAVDVLLCDRKHCDDSLLSQGTENRPLFPVSLLRSFHYHSDYCNRCAESPFFFAAVKLKTVFVIKVYGPLILFEYPHKKCIVFAKP